MPTVTKIYDSTRLSHQSLAPAITLMPSESLLVSSLRCVKPFSSADKLLEHSRESSLKGLVNVMKFQRLSVVHKSLNGLIIVGLLFVPPGLLATPVRAQSLEALGENPSKKILTKDELYFGLSKPEGGMVSEAQWQHFLNLVITPRFPTGLTVVAASGQYLNSSSELTKENTKLVILIYENSPTRNQMIAQIIDIYKRMFDQESVLRVTSSVRVAF